MIWLCMLDALRAFEKRFQITVVVAVMIALQCKKLWKNIVDTTAIAAMIWLQRAPQ